MGWSHSASHLGFALRFGQGERNSPMGSPDRLRWEGCRFLSGAPPPWQAIPPVRNPGRKPAGTPPRTAEGPYRNFCRSHVNTETETETETFALPRGVAGFYVFLRTWPDILRIFMYAPGVFYACSHTWPELCMYLYVPKLGAWISSKNEFLT